jgi:hypothetical protein
LELRNFQIGGEPGNRIHESGPGIHCLRSKYLSGGNPYGGQIVGGALVITGVIITNAIK